jgi:hypothetical protein
MAKTWSRRGKVRQGSEAWSDPSDNTDNLDQRREDPKPLAKTDRIENLNQQWHADQLATAAAPPPECRGSRAK